MFLLLCVTCRALHISANVAKAVEAVSGELLTGYMSGIRAVSSCRITCGIGHWHHVGIVIPYMSPH